MRDLQTEYLFAISLLLVALILEIFIGDHDDY